MLPVFLSAIESTEDADRIISLYTDFYALFCKTAYEIVKDSSLCKEIVHEAFTRTIRYMDRFRLLPYRNQVSYINKVTRNIAIEYYRDKQKNQYLEDTPSNFLSNDDITIEVEGYLELKEAILNLNDRDRDLICLKYSGYKEKEIAEVIGVNEKYVRQSVYRARQRIKKFLNKGVKVHEK